ncbi:hypermethylated in cancer 2 protein-like [Genypterus blacodes]|uniref:hypermethylated in cancer 2 protein-like n=1 Tax=Genypterus blacodes TaxID=154954 RepID=UPI003F77517B
MEPPNYAKQLLMQLNQQRSKGYMCDVIIVVENALFRAHKNILAARSSYFKSLVLHDNLINLDTEMVKPSVFRQVLDFIYTGQLLSSQHVSEQSFSSLLTAASYLQLADLAVLCRRRLKPFGSSKKLSPSNSSLTPNGLSFHRPHHSRTPLQVNYNSESMEGGRTHKQVQDLSEEELFIPNSSPVVRMSNSVDMEVGLRLELSRKSPEEVSPSSLKQDSPQSTTMYNSAFSDDAQLICTSSFYNPTSEPTGEGEAQQRAMTTTDSQQKLTGRRQQPANSQGCLQVSMQGNSQGPGEELIQGKGVLVKPEEKEEALENNMDNSEESIHSGSEDEEVNRNKNVSYICYQPQTGIEPTLDSNLYVCIPCRKGFPSSEHLKAHVDSHSAEELSIKVVDLENEGSIKDEGTDVAPEDLPKQSLKEKPGPEPMLPCHMCSVCSRSYMDVDLLRQHERSHWLSRSFPCNICGKLFTQRGTMTRHMRSHLGLKPFACNECGMRFTRQYRLTEHMRVHSGEKPYECQLCGVKFTQQRNLMSHLRMHTSPC